MRSKTILTTALCAVLLLGCEGTSPTPWAVTTLVPPGPFHGIHGLGYDRDGRLLAGSVVGAATYAVDRESGAVTVACLLYTSPSPRDRTRSRMPSSA